MNKNTFSSKHSAAFSLIEMLLVLGVLAVLLIAAFVVYPKVRDNSRAQTEAVNVRIIQTNLRNLFIAKGFGYGGLGGQPNNQTPSIANKARAFPVSMNGGDYSTGASVTSAWGGDVFVWSRPAIVTPLGSLLAGQAFGLVYRNVPPGICIPWVSSLSSDFHSILVGIAGEQTEVLTKTGLNVQALTTACNSTDNIEVTFTSI